MLFSQSIVYCYNKEPCSVQVPQVKEKCSREIFLLGEPTYLNSFWAAADAQFHLYSQKAGDIVLLFTSVFWRISCSPCLETNGIKE